ncbi:type IV pilus modification protein PilV [Methylophaga sulfidovorans]|nr:type IV pilus modification protein PilV [Methylophaga sulfidovorans]
MKKQQRGFTLLEVMVAVFVLALGLLGMAHLQVTTLKSNQTAGLESQANILASDILDRMRSNKKAAYTGAYNYTSTTDVSGTSISAKDLANWSALMKNNLPSGSGEITCPAYDSSKVFICKITISWSDKQLGDENTNYGDYDTSALLLESAI